MSTVYQARGSIGMDALQAFLDSLKRLKVADQHFLGVLHILIGRRIAKEDGTVISNGKQTLVKRNGQWVPQ